MSEQYIKQFEQFLEKENIEDNNNILGILKEKDLEEAVLELEKINSNLARDYAIELVCEELLITSSYKIERTGMKLGLHRMKRVLELLGSPEQNLKVIHVAGTNGKGSTCSYLKDVLKTKYRVGFYTSPGMISFNDRIRINDEFITYKRAYELFRKVREVWSSDKEASKENLSFFEIITAVAILYFNERGTDFVIMEVGLGGRFDATNIFEKKLLSVIAKIGLDHTDMLGDTIEKIAFEKAGIIQKNDNVIAYPAVSSVIEVIKEVCEEKQADLTVLNVADLKYTSDLRGSTFEFAGEKYSISRLGEHQVYNCALAIEALNNLRKRKVIEFSDKEIIAALKDSNWPGRLEWLKSNILVDGAHNIDGVTTVVKYLKQLAKETKIIMLVGILEDKDYGEMIELLKSIPAKFNIVPVPISVKHSNIDNLERAFSDVKVKKYPHYSEALEELIPNLKEGETLVITGSLYLISAVRKEILKS